MRLADNQESDGHWDSLKHGGLKNNDTFVTALALLSYAAAGQTVRSGKYRRTVRKAVKWFADKQGKDGNLAPGEPVATHAIATLALLEQYVMVPISKMKVIPEKAFKYLLSLQLKNSGWSKKTEKAGDTKADLLTTTWATMAMKAAKIAGIDVSAKHWAGVKAYLDKITDTKTGIVAATPKAGKEYTSHLMTACALLCKLYLGVSRDDKLMQLGIKHLLKNLPKWKQPGLDAPHYLYWYFGSLVMFQIEGEPWKKWNVPLRDMLIKHLNTTKGKDCGSWEPHTESDSAKRGGRLYSTAMATLTLKVYYRYVLIQPKKKP